MPQYDIWRQPYSKEQLAAAANNIVPVIDPITKNWKIWDIANMAWVDTGIPAAGKNPYIGSDNYWYVWDAATNQYVNTGYSVAQDAVQSVNGIFADDQGNVSIGWTNITGANPLTKGGTGGTSAAAGMHNLISALTALASSGLATGDTLALDDVSTATGKKVTLANLKTFFEGQLGFAKIQTGSYVGTGTYGAANPCSLTFDFEPKLVIIIGPGYQANYGNSIVLINGWGNAGVYQTSNFALWFESVTWSNKTVSWYNTNGTYNSGITYQANTNGQTYRYIGIG